MDDEYDSEYDNTDWDKLQKEQEMYEADWAEIRARYRESDPAPLEEYVDSSTSEIQKEDSKEKETRKILYKACAGYDSDEVSSEEETFTEEEDNLKITQLQSRIEELEMLAQQRSNTILRLQQKLNILQATALRQANEIPHRQSRYNPLDKNTHALSFFSPMEPSYSTSRNSHSAESSKSHL